jgi:DNA-directed RNA polymerase subunit M/transcription elongation factor TFIIS
MWPFSRSRKTLEEEAARLQLERRKEIEARTEQEKLKYLAGLEPFTTAGRACKKCGGTSSYYKHFNALMPAGAWVRLDYIDHLIVACATCGYTWSMKCKDAED